MAKPENHPTIRGDFFGIVADTAYRYNSAPLSFYSETGDFLSQNSSSLSLYL